MRDNKVLPHLSKPQKKQFEQVSMKRTMVTRQMNANLMANINESHTSESLRAMRSML
mgnify:CR=1 FL=1